MLTWCSSPCFSPEERRSSGLQQWLSSVSGGSGCAELQLALGAVIVEEMRAAVEQHTGYRCSAGISHNKVSTLFPSQHNQCVLPLSVKSSTSFLYLCPFCHDH